MNKKRYKGTDILKIMACAKNYNHGLVNLCLSKMNKNISKIVDFGAGTGTYAEIFRKKGLNVCCVELDDYHIKLLKEKGFDVNETIDFAENDSLENIVSYNVLEHIADDKTVLQKIYKKLKPDGTFFLFVPAKQSIYSEFDKNLGHFRRYEKNKFINLLKECNFEIREIFYYDSLGYILAKIYKKFNRSGKITKFQIQMYDNLIFPLTRILDKIFNKYFGKNLAVVLTKKHSC